MLARLVSPSRFLAFGPVAPSAWRQEGAARAPARWELRGADRRVDEAQREIVLDAADVTTQVKVAKDAKSMIDGSSAPSAI